MPDSPFLDQMAAANFLKLSPRTLERFRVEGRGPEYRKFGRRCLYHVEDLLAWADAQRRTSTSQPDVQPTCIVATDDGVGGS